MKNEIKVSVIMPAYNSEKYIGEAIESVFGQTFKDWELIVINDGSKDKTAEVVNKYSDERIRFINNDINHGFLYGLNYGISIANGEYIARLDDDDVAYSDRFEKQVKYLDEHPDIVLVGGQHDTLTEETVIKEDWASINSPEELKFTLLFQNPIGHSSFMSRKSIYDDFDIIYDTFIQTPDYHLLLDISRIGKIALLNDVVYKYRIHATQSTSVRSKDMKMTEKDRCQCMYIDSLELSADDRYILKKSVCRDLQTYDDYCRFNSAFINYARLCGIDTEEISLKNNKNIQNIRKGVFLSQKGSFNSFKGYIASYARESWFADIKWSILFIIRCIMKSKDDQYNYKTLIDYTKPVERKVIRYN